MGRCECHLGVLRVVVELDVLDHRIAVCVGRPIRDDDLERFQHSHSPLSDLVQPRPNKGLEQLDLVAAVGLRHADEVTELADRRSRVPATAKAAQRRQAGIVPTVDNTVGNQRRKLALRRDRVREFQSRELVLPRLVEGQRRELAELDRETSRRGPDGSRTPASTASE